MTIVAKDIATQFTSIEATGAKPGDRVRCVGRTVTAPEVPRFIEGDTYPVIDHCGRPAAHGKTDYRASKSDTGWNIPWLGLGYLWELAQ